MGGEGELLLVAFRFFMFDKLWSSCVSRKLPVKHQVKREKFSSSWTINYPSPPNDSVRLLSVDFYDAPIKPCFMICIEETTNQLAG